MVISKEGLYDAYVEASRKRGKLHLLDKARFAKKFIKATGATSAKLRDGYERVPSYRVPAWNVAAENFRQCCGVDIDCIEDAEGDRPY